ncbi:TonB-dependent receptor [Novosphingobium naphthalenivorans]|uniref:TonB-dependent receptor n=1 Tax=Novosphingobium naphthalenivorans TaxID=273168 RepID=UPI00083285D8|nr:TonB-dependent receptor [Novosphingobium naphthalenivorans]
MANAEHEIIVTAQKREQKLSDVGLSITAATGEQLETRGVTGVEDLAKIEPSMQLSKGYKGAPVYTIRGVGFYELGIMAPPTVSLYQDEVPFPYAVLSSGAMLDVQRVEVLKGPQGILYGQNATGGAVNFIANRPTPALSAGFNATYGRFDAMHFDAFISGPISDTLGVRVSGATDQGGAWQKSNTRDEKLGDKDYLAGRILLDWEPSDSFRMSLNLNGWRDKSDVQASQLVGFVLNLPAAASEPGFASVLANQPSPANARAADWVDGYHPQFDRKFYQAALRMDLDLSDDIGLTSLTSYQHLKGRDQFDYAGVNTLNYTSTGHSRIRSFFQELRLHGSIGGEGTWMIGANYERDKSSWYDDLNAFFSASYITTYLAGLDPWHSAIDVSIRDIKTKSIFANVSYPLTPTLTLNGGIRYTKADSKFAACDGSRDTLADFSGAIRATWPDNPDFDTQCYTVLPDGTNGHFYRPELHEDNVPWRVGLEWKVTPNSLLYTVVSKGYKAGSLPTVGASSYKTLVPAVQESLQAYEVGYKGQLFDRRLDLTLAAFHYDYKNKQMLGRILDDIFGPLPSLLNIPKSRVNGAEASFVWHDGGFTIDGAATYVDAKVTGTFLNFDAYGNAIDFKGEAFPFTPKWSLQGGIRYDWSLSDDLSAFVAARGSYQTRTVSAFGNQSAIDAGLPSLANKAYGLLDLSAGIESESGRWRAEIWGRNVTNTYYWTAVNYNIDTVTKFAGMPVTYGITLGYKY